MQTVENRSRIAKITEKLLLDNYLGTNRIGRHASQVVGVVVDWNYSNAEGCRCTAANRLRGSPGSTAETERSLNWPTGCGSTRRCVR